MFPLFSAIFRSLVLSREPILFYLMITFIISHWLYPNIQPFDIILSFLNPFLQLLAGKTKDIITNLKSLGSNEDGVGAGITLDTIKSRNFSAVMQNFLLHLAFAENLVKN